MHTLLDVQEEDAVLSAYAAPSPAKHIRLNDALGAFAEGTDIYICAHTYINIYIYIYIHMHA